MVQLQHKDGQKLELQFNTEGNLALKEAGHVYYKQIDEANTIIKTKKAKSKELQKQEVIDEANKIIDEANSKMRALYMDPEDGMKTSDKLKKIKYKPKN